MTPAKIRAKRGDPQFGIRCGSPFAGSLPKVNALTPSEFYQQYYFGNRPVVIRGLMRGWKALQIWSPEYFSQNFGTCQVEIMSGRKRDPLYELNFESHRKTISMKAYVRMVEEGGETNDYYLVAKNYLLKRRKFRPLLNDLKCPRGFLEPKSLNSAKFWFGPKGTVTHLHHDAGNVLFGQVYGRKQFTFIPPLDTKNVYEESDWYSRVDVLNIDYAKFPRMRRVSILETVIEPGEFIFIPVGWWHCVKSLDISISVSFSNFCVPDEAVLRRRKQRI